MWMKPVLGWVGGWYHIHRQYKYTWYFALLKRIEYAHAIVGNLICITLSLLDVWTPNRKIGLSFTVLLFNSFEFLAGDGLIIGNDTSSILNVGSCGWIWICLPVCLPDSTSHRCNIKFSRKLKCNRLWKSTHTHTQSKWTFDTMIAQVVLFAYVIHSFKCSMHARIEWCKQLLRNRIVTWFNSLFKWPTHTNCQLSWITLIEFEQLRLCFRASSSETIDWDAWIFATVSII